MLRFGKAEFEGLSLEVHGFRESMETEIRGFRDSVDARFNARDQVLDRVERHLERIDQRFDDQAMRHRATTRWIIGVTLALAGLILAGLRSGQTGIGRTRRGRDPFRAKRPGRSRRYADRQKRVIMPSMSRPAQRRGPPEYATKADVEVLAAEVRGHRESTEAEIRGLRESTEAEIRGLRESTEAEVRGLRESSKADVEVLAAEVRGLRESSKADVEVLAAEVRGFRESSKAEVEVLAAEVRGFRESSKAEVEVLAAEVRGHRESSKAEVEVLAAEVRGFRESTEAEIRELRESSKAEVEVLAAELRAQRESNDARLHAHDQAFERIERQFERQLERLAADHRATIRWIIGSVLALGGLILAILRFGQTGG